MKNELEALDGDLKIDREDILEAISQSSSTEAILPEKLPGINVAVGLERIGDKKQLYKKLLIRFYESYGDSAEHIRTYLKQGEPEFARQLCHTVKGISSNLSIDAAYEAAVALEAQLKSGDIENAWKFMEQYEVALEQVNDGLQKLKQEDEAAQTDQSTAPEERSHGRPNDAQIKPWLDKLGVFLKENNLEVEGCLEALEKELQGTKALDLIDHLKKQIDLFDFDKARKTYQKLKTTLNTM